MWGWKIWWRFSDSFVEQPPKSDPLRTWEASDEVEWDSLLLPSADKGNFEYPRSRLPTAKVAAEDGGRSNCGDAPRDCDNVGKAAVAAEAAATAAVLSLTTNISPNFSRGCVVLLVADGPVRRVAHKVFIYGVGG